MLLTSNEICWNGRVWSNERWQRSPVKVRHGRRQKPFKGYYRPSLLWIRAPKLNGSNAHRIDKGKGRNAGRNGKQLAWLSAKGRKKFGRKASSLVFSRRGRVLVAVSEWSTLAIYFSAVWEFKELHQPCMVSTVFVVGKNKEKITRVLYNQTKTDYKTSQHTRHSTRLKKSSRLDDDNARNGNGIHAKEYNHIASDLRLRTGQRWVWINDVDDGIPNSRAVIM